MYSFILYIYFSLHYIRVRLYYAINVLFYKIDTTRSIPIVPFNWLIVVKPLDGVVVWIQDGHFELLPFLSVCSCVHQIVLELHIG